MSRVLIVDNDSDRASEVRLIVERLGFDRKDVVIANSREQAEPLLSEPFDLAVIDLSLRGDLDEEGVDLITALHDRLPQCGIVALTSIRPGAKTRALRAGATFFIDISSPEIDPRNLRPINWRDSMSEKLGILRSLTENAVATT